MLFFTLAALTKLAQATAAERKIRPRLTRTKSDEVRTSVHIGNHKAAFSKERLGRWVHAHILVNVAITPLVCVLLLQLHPQSAFNSLRREISGSAPASQDGGRSVLVAEVANLATSHIGRAFGASEASVGI